jgi:hypothetical protein
MVSEVSDLSIYHPIRIRNYYMLVVVLILNVFKIAIKSGISLTIQTIIKNI